MAKVECCRCGDVMIIIVSAVDGKYVDFEAILNLHAKDTRYANKIYAQVYFHSSFSLTENVLQLIRHHS